MFLPPGCLNEEEAFSSLKQFILLLYCQLTADEIFWIKENLISGILILKHEKSAAK